MASISKRSDGYTVRWKEIEVVAGAGGVQTRNWVGRSRSCPDMATAKELKRNVEQQGALGERWTPSTEEVQATVQRICEMYLDDKVLSCRGSTARCCATNLDVFLRWLRVRERKVAFASVLTKALLTEYAVWLAKPGTGRGGRNRSSSTVNVMVSHVEMMWAWAANEDEFAEIVPRPRTIKLAVEARDPVQAPTWAEMDACIAVLGDTALGRLCTVLRYTGLRVSQAMRLVWEDVDFEGGTLRMRGVLGKTPHERLGRLIPISAFLLADLKRWKEMNRVWEAGWQRRGRWVPGTEAWVVPGHVPRDSPKYRHADTEIMHLPWTIAGVPQAIWTKHVHHCFRSGFTSNLKKDGADSEAVEHLVGHKIEGSRQSYLDPDYMPLRAAANAVPEIGTRKDGVHRMRIHKDEPPSQGGVYTPRFKDVELREAVYLRDTAGRGEPVEPDVDLSVVQMEGEKLGPDMRWSVEAAAGWGQYLRQLRLALHLTQLEASVAIKTSGPAMWVHENQARKLPPSMSLMQRFAAGYARDIREVVLAAGFVAGVETPVTQLARDGEPAWSQHATAGFGDYIRRKRLERGMSMKAAGRRVGVSTGQIQRYERKPVGRQPMRVVLVKSFAAAYGLDVNDVLRAAGYLVHSQ